MACRSIVFNRILLFAKVSANRRAIACKLVKHFQAAYWFAQKAA